MPIELLLSHICVPVIPCQTSPERGVTFAGVSPSRTRPLTGEPRACQKMSTRADQIDDDTGVIPVDKFS